MEPTDTPCPICEKAGKTSKLFVDDETGDVLCKKCGYVSQDRAIEEVSLTVYEKSMHAPKKRFERSTVINQNMDAKGKKIEASFKKMKSNLMSMGMWDDQIHKDPKDKIMLKFWVRFNELINILIPVLPEKIQEVPWNIYYKCLKKNLQQGRSAKPIMIAAICVFSLQHRIPSFDFSKYAKLTRVDKKKILEAYALIRTKLVDDVKVKVEYVSNTEKEIRQIIDLIRNDLNSFPDKKITLLAREIISEVSKSALTGGFTPKNQAAAAVFLACKKANFPITIPNIAKYADTSPSTMKNVCEKFNSKLNINF